MEVLVDTQVLVNAVIEDSKYHKEAKRILENSIVFVPSVVLEEFCFVLKRLGLDNDFIAKRGSDIVKNSIIVPVEDIDFEFAFECIRKFNLNVLHLNDLLVISVARRRGLEIMTFDKRMKKLIEKLK